MIADLLIFLLGGLSYLVLSASPVQKFPPPLSHEAESVLFSKMHAGDKKARADLIEHNLRLVAHIVRKYYTSQTGQEDLISIGTIGLIKAVDSFKSENGARFATYAAKCIQNEILMHFRAQKKISGEVSIDDTIDMDHDGNPLTYSDIIKVDDAIAEEIDEKWKIAKALRYIEKELTERERQIIVMRYGLNNRVAITQRETAARLGISRSYVSRIEKNVLSRLHDHLEHGE
jgi:RNA polymerase sporulation-specific sigma factor